MSQVKEKERADTYLDIKLRELEDERLRRLMPFLICMVSGFCFGRAELPGDTSPFAAGFLAAVPFKLLPGVLIGAVTGCLSRFSLPFAVSDVLCLCLVGVLRLFIHRRLKKLEKGFFLPGLTFFCVCGIAVAEQALLGVNIVGVALCVLEGAAGFLCAYLFARAFRLPVRRVGLFELPAVDRIVLGTGVFVFTFCASEISIEGFSPARIICFLLVCFISCFKGAAAGSAAGVFFGAALSLTSQNGAAFYAFSLSGLIAGAVAPLGQVATGVAACLSYCAGCAAGGFDEKFIVLIIECVAAGAVFVLIPPVQMSRFAGFVKKSAAINDDCVNLQVSAILKRASVNIGSFCNTVDEVSERLDRIINPEVNKLFFELQQKVCDGCVEKSRCWSNEFDSTAGDILAIMGIEKPSGTPELVNRCLRLSELKRQIRHGRAQYSLSMLAKSKNREMRQLLTGQFSGVGEFLDELSDKITKSRTVDTVRSMALRSVLVDAGIYPDNVSCFCCDEGRLSIEISCFETPDEEDYCEMKQLLEQSTGRSFDEPDISLAPKGSFIRFDENPPYYLLVGTAQRPVVRDAPCGDSFALCKRSDTSSAVILSDGMGTGSTAALDSTMAVSLTEKLISGGFSFESAVRLVNSSLIMKSTDESMATMDGLSVNLYTGEADFYKAGAAISFIRSGIDVFIIEESSLPLGILREVNLAKTSMTLQSGDIVLLVSDGITAGDCGWINDELLSWSTNNMDELAGHIVQLAALRQDRLTGDDLTVIAVKIAAKQVSLVRE